MGRASRLIFVFGEERVPGNEVPQTGAAISKKFQFQRSLGIFRPKSDAFE
jgi:hypothetical protein